MEDSFGMTLPHVVLTLLLYPEKKTRTKSEQSHAFSNFGLHFGKVRKYIITFFQELDSSLQIIVNK